jgi:murein DD-endopeptidase MepM/ murein hydrolase activator NlpD
MQMSLKNKANKKIKQKAKKIAFKVLKPFLPFIIIFFGLLFAFCTIIDAIFVQEVQSDSSSMPEAQKEIKSQCIEKAEYLNTCHNYKGDELTNNLLDMDNREIDKEIQWSHLYAIMAFHNMTDNTEINETLLNKVASQFESTFKYETYTIKTETTTKDEDGNETTSTKEETIYLLIESDTIMGHYKYNYEEKTIEKDNVKTTKKVFTNEELIGEKYERLKQYLKNNLHIREDDIDTDVEVVIQAASGYYDGKENTSWLQGSSSSDTIITDGKGLVPTGMFTWPIPGYTNITSHFGMRTHPITGVYKLHSGTDVSAPIRSKFCGYGRWYSYKSRIFKFIWKYGNDRPSVMELLLYMHMVLKY